MSLDEISNTQQCQAEKQRALYKEKINRNRHIRRVLNKSAQRCKEKKNDIQTNGDDEDRVITVD